jgi:hypothetical protein
MEASLASAAARVAAEMEGERIALREVVLGEPFGDIYVITANMTKMWNLTSSREEMPLPRWG